MGTGAVVEDGVRVSADAAVGLMVLFDGEDGVFEDGAVENCTDSTGT